MTDVNLTLAECERAVTFALGKVADIPYRPDSWNAEEFIVKEECLGSACAGMTAYKCSVGYNVDFDLRCSICGAILALGSVDIEGPVHGTPDDGSGVVLARSASELTLALGGQAHKASSPTEAARVIWERLRKARECDCALPMALRAEVDAP